jgi:hypothetical protein
MQEKCQKVKTADEQLSILDWVVLEGLLEEVTFMWDRKWSVIQQSGGRAFYTENSRCKGPKWERAQVERSTS